MLNITESDLDLLTEISEGSPGLAKMIYENEGLWILDTLTEIFNLYPKYDYLNINKFAEKVVKSDKGWEVFCYLLNWLLTRLAKTYVSGRALSVRGNEIAKQINMPLLIDEMAAWNKLTNETEIFNLDEKQVVTNQLTQFADCFA